MEQYTKLPLSVLQEFPEVDKQVIHKLYEQEFQDFHRKIMVLDDDPTGVQTVHDVPVYTDWSCESLKSGFKEDASLFFVLTNSRSFSAKQTKEEHKIIAARAWKAAQECGKELLIISRGDSTLRGHYPLEPESLRDSLEEAAGKVIHGQILCPFFEEGGRYTIHGVHYVQEENWLVPVGETEFARDKTFGFQSSHLGDYAQEKSEGRYLRENGIYITLEMLREQKLEEITDLLMQARDFQLVVADAIAESDVETFAVCLLRSLKAGKEFLIRSAAAMPKIVGNISARPLLTAEELTRCNTDYSNGGMRAYGGIVLVGSHVRKTTLQLEALKTSDITAEFLEFHVNACLQEGGLERETAQIIESAEQILSQGKTVVIYSSRTLLAPQSATGEELLQLSVKISDALTAVIAGLHQKPKFLIAKGGITSSDVGTKALSVKRACVLGQIQPGIPVWRTGPESKFPDLPYIIFPGNVGDKYTLKKIVEQLS